MYNLCVLNIYKHDILCELHFTIKELVLFKTFADSDWTVQLLCSKSAAMSLILLLWLAFSAAAFRVALEIGMEDSVMDLNSPALSLTLTSSSMMPLGGDSWAEADGAGGQLVLEGRGRALEQILLT